MNNVHKLLIELERFLNFSNYRFINMFLSIYKLFKFK